MPRLGRAYSVYCLGLLAFIILVGLLEQVGIPSHHIGWLLGALPLVVFAAIGVASRTMRASEFYVAGRDVSSVFNGMASAADWISAGSFIGVAGVLYASGEGALVYIVGATGGFVLLAVLIAPFLRKSGAYTVPDFLALRFGSAIRAPAVAVLVCCSFPLLVGQIQAFALITARLVSVPYAAAVQGCVVVILLSVLLGGMRGLTRVQAAQYFLLAFAFLLPPVLVSSISYGVPLPMLTVGRTLAEIDAISAAAPGLAPAAGAPAGVFADVALIFCLATGTASMPHLLMRFLTVRSARDARGSVGWSLVFACLVLLAAPAYAAYFRLGILSAVADGGASGLPDWLFGLGQAGVLKICGIAPTTPELLQATCAGLPGAGPGGGFRDIQVARDAVVLAMPAVAGFPFVITALLAAGGMAAALASACGLTLAIGNALSHDIWHKLIDRRAPTGRRLLVARLLLLTVALAAGRLANVPALDILALVVWAGALAAAGYFPVLVLAGWWRRCNALGALCGMGGGMATALLWLSTHGALFPATSAIDPASVTEVTGVACLLAVGCGFVVAVAVSLLTPAPSYESQIVVDKLRMPCGEPILADRPV